MEYASNAKGNLGVTLGAIGTGLSALNSNGILGNLFGNGNNTQYVNKETYDVQLQLIDAQKNNAILAADLNTETKIVDAYKSAVDRENKIRDELKAEIAAVAQNVQTNAATQAVINTQTNAQMALNTNNISQLLAMTKMVIPNTSVCPGWGNVTITPTISTGTTTA